MHIFISSGELSGDLAGAGLAQALRQISPQLSLSGVGGRHMAAAGVSLLDEIPCTGSVGLTEGLSTMSEQIRAFRVIRRHLIDKRPDVAVLIGHDFFHMLLGRWIGRSPIIRVAYFPPQAWLWRRFAKPISRCFDLILTAFAEEEQIYRQAGAEVRLVGHFLADRTIPKECSPTHSPPLVGLFPGSRLQEVERMLPLFLQTAQQMSRRQGELRFAVSVADARFRQLVEKSVQASQLGDRVSVESGIGLLNRCQLALMTSGTATLEAAVRQVPLIIAYRLSRTTYLATRLIKMLGWIEKDTIGLPNLLLGEEAIPEFRQGRAQPEPMAVEALKILNDDQLRIQMRQRLKQARRQAGPTGASMRAAEAVLEMAGRVHREAQRHGERAEKAARAS